ncbi:helix-turn-helix domain-containing protein [Wenyingzhuangia sp. IMCC45574]
MERIGDRLKQIRVEKGISQEDLAELAKVSSRTIQRIENNESEARPKTLALIYDALEITKDDVFVEEENGIDKKYLIASVLLTLLIIVSSFMGWCQFETTSGEMHDIFGKMRMTTYGWSGSLSVKFIPITMYNWFVSVCAISVGVLTIFNSLGLLFNKLRYVIFQNAFILFYFLNIIGMKVSSIYKSVHFIIKPGLFLVVIASILLLVLYKRKRSIYIF